MVIGVLVLPSLAQSEQDIVVTSVSHLGVLEVTGPDAFVFLQGQVTCDLNALDERSWLAGAYCDPKGKTICSFRILGSGQKFFIFLHQDLVETTVAQLKKYGVFSNVSITPVTHEQPLFLAWGKEAAASFQLLQTQTYTQTDEALYIALSPHLVLIRGYNQALTQHPGYTPEQDWWQAAMLSINWVDVPASFSMSLIPQAFNLDEINAIGFKKGCYIGQEIIARIHYKGNNRRVTRRLQGQSSVTIDTGDLLEYYLSDKSSDKKSTNGEGTWLRAGTVLQTQEFQHGVVILQAVIANDLDESLQFRIQGQDDSQFTLWP